MRNMLTLFVTYALLAEVNCSNKTVKMTSPAHHVSISSQFDVKTNKLVHTLDWPRLVGTSKTNNKATIGVGGSAGSCTRRRSQLVSTFYVPVSSVAAAIDEAWLNVKVDAINGPLDVNLYAMKPVATIVDKEDISALHTSSANATAALLASDADEAIATPFLSVEKGAAPFLKRINVTKYVRARVAAVKNNKQYQPRFLLLPFRLRTATDLGCNTACDGACSIRRIMVSAVSIDISQTVSSPGTAIQSYYVQQSAGPKLHYASDTLGNRLPDFSSVGYVHIPAYCEQRVVAIVSENAAQGVT